MLLSRTSVEAGHLPECDTIHAPDAYREEIERHPDPDGAFVAHLRRTMGRSEGIYLVRCADGCPVLERNKARARDLAAKYSW